MLRSVLPEKPLNTRAVILLIALVTFGFVLNRARFHLFFNVDFIFGSAVAIVILFLYGPLIGVAASVVIASATYILWLHPYAIFIFAAETFLLAFFYRRKHANVLVIVASYWIVIGMPLVVLLYRGVMGLEMSAVLVVMMKQALNGVFNALIAAIAVGFLGRVARRLDLAEIPAAFSFRRTLFDVITVSVLIPAIVIMMISARRETHRVEQTIQHVLNLSLSSARESLSGWIDSNLYSMASLADFIDHTAPSSPDDVREHFHILVESSPDFVAAGIVTHAGHVAMIFPDDMPDGMPRSGRRYDPFEGRRSDAPSVSGVMRLMTDGPPIVIVAVPIRTFDGYVVGLIDLGRLTYTVQSLVAGWGIDAVVTDANHAVIASTETRHVPGHRYTVNDDVALYEIESDLYVRFGSIDDNISIMERWSDSVYVRTGVLDDATGWRISLSAPVQPYQRELNQQYTLILFSMLVVVLAAIAVSTILSRRMVSALADLSQATANLPGKIVEATPIEWPSSRILEVQTLIGNFRTTSDQLLKKVRDLGHANTELVKAKAEADTANRAKSLFLANISHDLRTPLNGILGYAQILRNEQSLSETDQKSIKIIERSANHLLNLINDILDVAKIETERLQIEQRPVGFRAFLDDIADMMRLQARKKGLEFRKNFSDDLPETVMVDEKRLRQILLNLLTNAVKFTDSGAIDFSVAPDAAKIRFTVEDTGIGIPSDRLDEIFDPFQQIDKHAQSDEGTGLGLAIVKRLVDMMGGTIEVQSRPGTGSRFSFSLSLETRGALAVHTERRRVVGYEGRRVSVLVVDDRWENRSVMRNMLEPIGFTFFEADGGRSGIDAAIEHRPDIVFMDLVMPNLDGFEALRRLRASDECANTKIVGVSASVAESIRHECLRIGFDGFIPKPVRFDEILDEFERHLGLKWITTSDEPPTETESDDGLPEPPSQNALDSLTNATKRGDIRAIIEIADEIDTAEPQRSDFARTVREFARNFQVVKLAQFIGRYTGNGDD